MALKISDEIINYIRSKINNLNYPVGYIFITTTNTNPNKILGVGTWVAFGTGKTLVGIDTSQTEFNSIEKTGGSKTHTLTIDQMPTHDHPADDSAAGGHAHGVYLNRDMSFPVVGFPGWTGPVHSGNRVVMNQSSGYGFHFGTDVQGVHDHNIYVYNRGGSKPHNNLQPYITVYMWKRTK